MTLRLLLLVVTFVVGVPVQPVRSAPPKPRSTSLAVEIVDKTVEYPLARAFDLPDVVRRITGHPYEAVNVDPFDDVPNSGWFTHRNDRTPLSPAQIRAGAGGSGPDTTGQWRVVAFKSAGVTPGMTIVDGSGNRYLIKFDPPGFEGLASGAEVVSSRLFHAAGYNVPQNHVIQLDPSRLVCAEDAVHDIGPDDGRQPLSRSGLNDGLLTRLMRRANPASGPRVRALASRFLSGRILGPFAYVGARHDDPQDIYRHEHRRELRGLYVVASWLNHADMKEENTLDVYDPVREGVVHYLIDFGASLGSNSTGPSNPRRGRANSFDLTHSLVRLVTAGLFVYDYERDPGTIVHPAVGYLDNDLFRPDGWKPMYPAPPFDQRTDRDAFWGARIVTSFDDSQIAAAVDAASYPEEAAQAMISFLAQRRDRIGRYWFSRVNPLDRFIIRDGQLHFEDLAILRGYAPVTRTDYQVEVSTAVGRSLKREAIDRTVVDLESSWRQDVVVSLRPLRSGFSGGPVRVQLRRDPGG